MDGKPSLSSVSCVSCGLSHTNTPFLFPFQSRSAITSKTLGRCSSLPFDAYFRPIAFGRAIKLLDCSFLTHNLSTLYSIIDLVPCNVGVDMVQEIIVSEMTRLVVHSHAAVDRLRRGGQDLVRSILVCLWVRLFYLDFAILWRAQLRCIRPQCQLCMYVVSSDSPGT